MNSRQISEVAQSLQRDLFHYGPRLGRAIPDFNVRFVPILRAYSNPFLVRKFRNDAAFRASLGRLQITFNTTSFRMFHEPIELAEQRGVIPPEMAVIAKLIATEQLIIHELTHVSVGLVHFREVQKFKGLVGVNALGELDLIADATAARICARLEMFRAQEKGGVMYASRLLQQLFVMGRFAFPAFGAPADKLHKRQRFLGLAMMTARVVEFLQRAQCKLEEGEFAVDTPIYPHLEMDGGCILISAFSPDRVLWGGTVQVDADLLKLTCDELDSAPFEVSVDRAAKLLRQAGQLKGPVSRVPRILAAVG